MVRKIGLFPIAGSDSHSWRLEMVLSCEINKIQTEAKHTSQPFNHKQYKVIHLFLAKSQIKMGAYKNKIIGVLVRNQVNNN